MEKICSLTQEEIDKEIRLAEIEAKKEENIAIATAKINAKKEENIAIAIAKINAIKEENIAKINANKANSGINSLLVGKSQTYLALY